jgi:hypothetical protein
LIVVELTEGTPGTVTVKFDEEVPDSLPTVTRIGPEVAPEGTVAVRLVLLVKVGFVEAVPLKETVAFEAKFVPLIVTAAPTGPEAGEKEVMVGAVAEVGVPVILKSSTSHNSLTLLLSRVMRILRLLVKGMEVTVTVLNPSFVLAPPPAGEKSTGEVSPS